MLKPAPSGGSTLRVGFISLGCPKNQLDCELMLARAVGAGFTLTPHLTLADAIVINTCSFIQPAIDEADEAIREALACKQRGSCRAVIVAGCLPQYLKQRAAELYPDVDAWLTPDTPAALPDVLTRLLAAPVAAGFQPSADPARKPAADFALPTFLASQADGRILTTPPSLAYVKIAEGCNHHCAFCIIPQLRGRYRSRSIEDLAAEVAGLVARGIPEIVLVSQDSSYYGRDLRDGSELAALLARLCALEGDFWLRVMYLHPEHITPSLIDSWAGLAPKLLPYFDIPLQHVSAGVLRAMGRSGGPAATAQLLNRIRRAMPQAVIRTTLLVGYPGETAEQFAELKAWVETGGVDHLGVFAYSELPGMRSARLSGKVPPEVAEKRAAELMLAQQAVVAHNAVKLRGEVFTIIVEQVERGPGRLFTARGRSWRQAYEVDGQVKLISRQPPELFKKLKVRISGATGYDLLAELA